MVEVILLEKQAMKKKIPNRLKRRYIRKLIIGLLSVCLLTYAIKYGYVVEASRSDYTLLLKLPENQKGGISNYFDLMMEPSKEQIIEVEFQNHSNRDVIVNMEITNAGTNSDGVVEYGNPDLETNDSLKHNLADLISTEKETKVLAGEAHIFQFTINMLEEEFDGLLAGGIIFQVKPTGETKLEQEPLEESDRGSAGELGNLQAKEKDFVLDNLTESEQVAGTSFVQVANVREVTTEETDNSSYSYVVAVLLRVNENAVVPKLNLTDISIGSKKTDHSVKINIQNEAAAFANEVSIDVSIYGKEGSEILYETHGENMQVAPNSNFEFPVTDIGEELEGGDYILKLEINSEEGSWNYEEEFTIEEAFVESIQDSILIPEEESESFNIKNIILIAAGTVLIIFAISMLWIKKKQREEDELIKVMKEVIKSI